MCSFRSHRFDTRRTYQAWSALAEAERQQRRAADLSQRAFELGEASLAEALVARRTALQAALAERAAALQSWHAQAVYDSFVAAQGEGLSSCGPRACATAGSTGTRARRVASTAPPAERLGRANAHSCHAWRSRISSAPTDRHGDSSSTAADCLH